MHLGGVYCLGGPQVIAYCLWVRVIAFLQVSGLRPSPHRELLSLRGHVSLIALHLNAYGTIGQAELVRTH